MNQTFLVICVLQIALGLLSFMPAVAICLIGLFSGDRSWRNWAVSLATLWIPVAFVAGGLYGIYHQPHGWMGIYIAWGGAAMVTLMMMNSRPFKCSQTDLKPIKRPF